MKNRTWILNTALCVVVLIALAATMLVDTFAPAVVLPVLNIPAMVLLSLIALLADYYLSPNTKRCYVCCAIFGALCFGALPAAAGFVALAAAWKYALIGGVVFTLCVWVFSAMQDRITTGRRTWLTPWFFALGLFLAAQCFSGILL